MVYRHNNFKDAMEQRCNGSIANKKPFNSFLIFINIIIKYEKHIFTFTKNRMEQ